MSMSSLSSFNSIDKIYTSLMREINLSKTDVRDGNGKLLASLLWKSNKYTPSHAQITPKLNPQIIKRRRLRLEFKINWFGACRNALFHLK